MTKDRDFKKVVRARMAKTGESYAAARARTRPQPKARYSFDSFTADAKKALVRAEVMARRQNCTYIGTDHLLIAVAYASNQTFTPVSTPRVERLAETQVEGEGLRPSRETELAIQRAFELAKDAGEPQVTTEHLAEAAVSIPNSRAAAVSASRTVHGRWLPFLAPDLAALLGRAQQRARESGAEQVTLEDLLAVLDEGAE